MNRRHLRVVGRMHACYHSYWLYHFYGHNDFRSDLQIAVKGLLLIFSRAQDADQERQIEETLCMVLTHQLDWSLDDLELDWEVRQIVDGILADLPAPDFEME